MNRFISCIILVCIFFSCSKKNKTKQDDRYETRNIYVETVNFPDSILSRLTAEFTNRVDTVYDFYRGLDNFIVYRFRDANDLPTSNLLDGTRKVNFRLYDERDSVGNPYYSFSIYKSENSRWKRVYNFGRTSFCQDTLIDEDFMLQAFIHRLDFRNWKGLP